MTQTKVKFEDFLTKVLYDKDLQKEVFSKDNSVLSSMEKMGIEPDAKIRAAADALEANKDKIFKDIDEIQSLASVMNNTEIGAL